jgi:hypothetical protein
MEDSQNYTSVLGTFILVIFLEIFIYTQMIGCGQGDKHKKYIGFYGRISGEVCEIFDVEIHNAKTE